MDHEYFEDDELREALLSAESIKLSAIPPEDELNHCFSGRFRRKMKKLIKEQRRTPFQKKIHSWAGRAAAIVLAIAGLGLGMTMSVDAYRDRLVNFIVEVYHDLTLLRRDGELELDMDGAIFVEPEHIPERFQLAERTESETSLDIFYITEENEVLGYHQVSKGSSVTWLLDTEDAEVLYIEIEGIDIMAIKKGKTCKFFWQDEKFSYLISGYVTMEEMELIAESVLKK